MFSEPFWVTCLVREESLVNCGSVVTQVLLFLQEEKEESPPEAQVNEGNGENLKHCGHCRVLNGSNYTEPRPPPLYPPSPLPPSSPPPPHLTSSVTVPPTSCSLWFSALPGYWQLKGMLRSCWLHNRLLIPLSVKHKCIYITVGEGAGVWDKVERGKKKSRKTKTKSRAVIMKLEYHGVNMIKKKKKHCLRQLVYFRFHKDQLMIRWNHLEWFDRKTSAN